MEKFTFCLLVVFCGSVFVLVFYHFYFFSRLGSYRETASHEMNGRGVSVVIAAWNELENLQKLLPMLLKQSYPLYEIIIVDDRSNDECYDYLLYESLKHNRMKLRRVNETPEHISSKKYAITLGIKAAQYETILLTDADCMPQSDDWIRSMVESMGENKQIVLGFSPYRREPGVLNWMIRYETFYTAVQYFSFAMAGVPYMGVGRNLGYKKSVFINNKGFNKHSNIVGGDDDLFVGEVANGDNVAICLEPEGFIESVPKTTFRSWFRQKKRHLSVGKHYSGRNKTLLGILSLSQLLFWVSFITLIILQAFIPIVLAVFILRMIAWVTVLQKAARKLQQHIRWYLLPAFDFIYTIYYLCIGVTALLSKRIQWR